MEDRIDSLGLSLEAVTWAQNQLKANPRLAVSWDREKDNAKLAEFIIKSAASTQTAPAGESQPFFFLFFILYILVAVSPGPLWGSMGFSGSSSHSGG